MIVDRLLDRFSEIAQSNTGRQRFGSGPCGLPSSRPSVPAAESPPGTSQCTPGTARRRTARCRNSAATGPGPTGLPWPGASPTTSAHRRCPGGTRGPASCPARVRSRLGPAPAKAGIAPRSSSTGCGPRGPRSCSARTSNRAPAGWTRCAARVSSSDGRLRNRCTSRRGNQCVQALDQQLPQERQEDSQTLRHVSPQPAQGRLPMRDRGLRISAFEGQFAELMLGTSLRHVAFRQGGRAVEQREPPPGSGHATSARRPSLPRPGSGSRVWPLRSRVPRSGTVVRRAPGRAGRGPFGRFQGVIQREIAPPARIKMVGQIGNRVRRQLLQGRGPAGASPGAGPPAAGPEMPIGFCRVRRCSGRRRPAPTRNAAAEPRPRRRSTRAASAGTGRPPLPGRIPCPGRPRPTRVGWSDGQELNSVRQQRCCLT